MKKKERTTNPFHINPKFRAYGKARLDIAQRAGSEEDWLRLWKNPSNSFPFTWNGQWKHCIEYRVDDFAAEVGFLIDILGLPVNAFDPDYAMFTSPAGDFFFSVVPATEDMPSTPPDAIRIQFMIADIRETALELERRGIPFEMWPQACLEGSSLFIGYFRTPHGICVDLWGSVETDEEGDQDERSRPSGEEINYISSYSDLPEESQSEEDVIFPPPEDSQDEESSPPGTIRGPEKEELIKFNLFGQADDKRVADSGDAENIIPPEEDQPEDDVIELEYEYIDDEV
jgi:hypothetical protein